MIHAVKTPQDRSDFAAIITSYFGIATQMYVRLQLFGAQPASGWQFYLIETADAQRGALCFRGANATVVGVFDAEELGSFLSFVGVTRVVVPYEHAPDGFSLLQPLRVCTLAAGAQLPLPACAMVQEGQVSLDTAPPMQPIVSLLWGDEADETVREQYYSDNCTARNHGLAEYWLVRHGDVPVFTVSASAIHAGHAYLSAGETIEQMRGRGIGGYYIAALANQCARSGLQVSFICEPPRYRFYERLGFTTATTLYHYEKT